MQKKNDNFRRSSQGPQCPFGMFAVHMRPLQNVLNSAARVVLKMTKFQHYCSRPRSAPLAACETTCGVQAGVIRVQGPPSDSATVPCRHVSNCQPVSTSSTRRHLRSAAHWDLVELRCRTTRYGKRSLPASAPLTLNSL